MSLRAELARLGLRLFVKRPRRRNPTLAAARASLRASEAWIPRAPAGTERTAVDAGGVPAEMVRVPASRHDRHVLYLHGGGYVSGSPALYRHFTWRLAAAAQAPLLVADYRLAPEHPFPAALDDALTAFGWLRGSGAAAQRTVVMGDSAGGGLALALLLKLRDMGEALPAAAVAISPWTDLALTGASMMGFEKADPMLTVADTRLFAGCYVGGGDPRHPYVSPLYANPAGLPPTLIQVGSDEILRDDAVRMAARMQAAGCPVEIEVWPRMPHVWHLLAPVVPEAGAAIARIGAFTSERLPA